MAALAGLLVIVGVASLQLPQAMTVPRTGLVPAVAMAMTFISTLVIPLQYAIMVGVGISLVLALVQESNRVRVVRIIFRSDGEAEEAPARPRLSSNQAIALMIYGSLTFAAATALEKILPVVDNGTSSAVVVLTVRGRAEVGSTFIDVVRRYAKALQAHDGKLMLSGVGPELFYQLEHTATLALLGEDNVYREDKVYFASTRAALEAANAWLER